MSIRINNKIISGKKVDQVYDANSTNAQSGTAVAGAISGKQDTLQSGTNIKTINNNSILGSGNITTLENTATNEYSLSILGDASNVPSTINLGYDSGVTGANSIAIGVGARANANGAIQIGPGINNSAYALNIGFNANNYTLLDSTGIIPDQRINPNIAREVTQNINNTSSSTIQVTQTASIYSITPTSAISILISVNDNLKNQLKASSVVITFELKINLNSIYAVSFPNTVSWLDDEVPDMSSIGTYYFAFRSHTIDASGNVTKWHGNLQGMWN